MVSRYERKTCHISVYSLRSPVDEMLCWPWRFSAGNTGAHKKPSFRQTSTPEKTSCFVLLHPKLSPLLLLLHCCSAAATEPTGNTSHHEDSVYTPATNKAPALNPPQPKIYDESTELTARGLSYATMDWMVSHNYAVTTGDSTVARAAIDSKTLPAFIEMYDTYDEVYRQDSWIIGGIMYLEPAPKSFAETERSGVYSMNVRYGRECGSWTIDHTETYECTEGSRGIPATIFARFTGERWVIEDLLFAPA